MSNPFGNLNTDNLQENEDRLGGFSRPETDVYLMTIKVAYAGESQGGAKNVTLIGSLGSQEYRETIYVTNKKGENFFLSKTEKDANDNPKKIALPGFSTIDDICQMVAGKGLGEQTVEEKIVNVYDPEAKKEMPKAVPVLTELTGKTILLGIKKVLVNKSGPAPDYAPTEETREENAIEKVFHPELRVTMVEAKEAAKNDKQPVAAFIDAWIERNKGKTQDKRTIKDGAGVKSGRPGSSNGGAPQAGAQSARKSLFGNQAAA